MWDRTAEPLPADTARQRNPGPQILQSHALGRGMVFCVIEPRASPSRSMQQGPSLGQLYLLARALTEPPNRGRP